MPSEKLRRAPGARPDSLKASLHWVKMISGVKQLLFSSPWATGMSLSLRGTAKMCKDKDLDFKKLHFRFRLALTLTR